MFNVIGKKNNQTSVSDADREIPTLGSTDNAGNSGEPSFWHCPLTLGLGFLGLHRKPMIDSIYPTLKAEGYSVFPQARHVRPEP